jgi:hypothetical protein
MEFHNPALLPLIPERLRRERYVFERYDTRFRAAARLLQSIWRERRSLPFGHHIDERGGKRRLGSKLAPSAAEAGANFLSPEIFGQARCDLAYREPGALIDAERLWANLLSSMPLAFNLLAPLKTDKMLARKVFAKLLPGFAKQIIHLQYEHSPGRGDPTFTADGSAFDAFISARSAEGAKLFMALEIKYSEGMVEPEARLRPRYDALSETSGLYSEPQAEALRKNPLQQFWRQHMLAQSMLDCGLYDGGIFILIAPRQNREVATAARRYAATLKPDETKVRFVTLDLEDVIAAIEAAGVSEHAAALRERYTDFTPVHDLVRQVCFAQPRRKRPLHTLARPHGRGPAPKTVARLATGR